MIPNSSSFYLYSISCFYKLSKLSVSMHLKCLRADTNISFKGTISAFIYLFYLSFLVLIYYCKSSSSLSKSSSYMCCYAKNFLSFSFYIISYFTYCSKVSILDDNSVSILIFNSVISFKSDWHYNKSQFVCELMSSSNYCWLSVDSFFLTN